MQGRIMKATGGFYYVRCASEIIPCRARGLFRKDGISPCVGDIADVSVSGEDGSGTVIKIHARKNALLRPPLANLDYMILIVSVFDPAPNFLIIDKLLAILEHKDIPAIIAVTKPDLADAHTLADIYTQAGYPVYTVNNRTGEGADALSRAIGGKLCALCGNSGVGKSSLLNAIDPSLALAVGDTSRKLGRGRHTTRHVEIFELQTGAMVADTPGFSSVDLLQMSDLRADDLVHCFIDFAEHIGEHGNCRFQDCKHITEHGCAIRGAVDAGKISESRYRSYCALHGEIKDVKEWERR